MSLPMLNPEELNMSSADMLVAGGPMAHTLGTGAAVQVATKTPGLPNLTQDQLGGPNL